MVIMDETLLKRNLSDRGLRAPGGWLDECINFFKSSHEQFTAKQLEDFVFDQWLLADLRELKLPSFPPNLADKRKIVLTGNYTCQIESVLDIGHSAYSQYQKISKKDTTNLEIDTETDKFTAKWEPKSSRTLMLYICDGVQEMRAMEFKPVSVLNTSIIPGAKALVKGPVLCRRGIIMLEESKISILGGEVDKFIIPNAYENILATCLELPLNPDPYNLGVNGEQDPAAGQQNGNVQPRRTAQEENRRIPADNRQPARATLPNASTRTAPPQRIPENLPQRSNQQYQLIEDDFGDDEALLNIDLDFETEFLNQHNVQGLGRGTSHNDPNGEQAKSISNLHRPDEASSSVNRDSEPSLRRQQNLRSDGEGTSNNGEHAKSKSKQSSMTAYLSGKTSSNVRQNLKSEGPNQPNLSFRAGTSSASSHVTEQSKSNRNILQSAISPNYLIEEDDEDILLAVDLMDNGVSTANEDIAKPSTSNTESKGGAVHQQKNDIFDNDICLLDEGYDEALLRLASAHTETRPGNVSHDVPARNAPQPQNISPSPFVHLSHVKEIRGKSSRWKRVRVKAIIVKVTEKISVSKGEWRLGVQIMDGSAKLPVQFSSELVSKLFELTPAELSTRKKAAAQHPDGKAELKKHFVRAQAKLLNINSIFEIDVTPKEGPLVVAIHEVTAEHVVELKKRSRPK